MKGLYTWIDRYFPCPFERGGPLLVFIGVISTIVYVYAEMGFDDELRDLPQKIMVLTFFISAWGQRQKLKSDLMFQLLVLAFLIPWLLFGINALIDYETAIKYQSTNDLLKLFLFLPLAWWAGGTRVGVIRMLTIAFLGLLTAIALDPNLMKSLSMLWAGRRVDFGIHNAQHGALLFGLVVLFCACSLSQRVQNEPVLNWLNGLLFLAGVVGVIGLVATQTRAAFLGLFVCALVALVGKGRKIILSGQNHMVSARAILVLAIITVLLAWPAKEILYDRLVHEKRAFHKLVAGNLDEIPFSSVGIRVHSWAEALKWVAARPITGWGQNARSDVIQLAEHFPRKIKARFGHLHNGYLEIIIGYGAVGFIFLCVLWAVLLSRIKAAASQDLYAFTLYSCIFFLVLNMFESFFIKGTGEYAMALFMAGGYCQYLARRLGNEPRAAHTLDGYGKIAR